MPKTYNKKLLKRYVSGARKKVVMSDNNQTKAIISLERRVKRMAGQRETKYIDSSAYGASMAYNSSVANYSLCTPAQGDGISERVGDKVDPFWVSIKATIASTSTASEVVRVLLIKCKKGNGFTPSIGNASSGLVLQSQGTSQAPWNPIYYPNRSEFTILADRTFTLQGNTTSLKQISFKINKRLSGPCEFVPGTTTPEGGQIWLLAISSTPTGSSPPTLYYTSRVYYKD